MAQDAPEAWRSGINARVLAHLGSLSAHSDVASELTAAVKPLGDVQTFCPDWGQYRYVAVSTNGIIFGFAAGLSQVAFRLDARLRARALATGGEPCPAAGDDWVSFVLFRDDWPKADLRFWAQKAYVAARENPAEN